MIDLIISANSRIVTLLYLAIVSLAPSIVCPPERNFNEGQPELQQAMDNMILRDEIMKKSVSYPSSDDRKAASMFSTRATLLLDEAENMLVLAKDTREKAWLEHFVHKLKTLASLIEQNIANHTREDETYTFATIEKAKTLDGDTSLQSLDFKSETVPETGPGQIKSNQMTSKLPSTLPEINQVKSETDYATIDHVTKPGIIPPLTDKVKDELVEELESLHRLSSLEPLDKSITAPETSSTSVQFFTQSSLTSGKNEIQENEQKRKKLKERIANEVDELKKLGETEKNILNAIHMESFKLNGVNLLKKEQSPSDHSTAERVLNENTPHYWTQPVNQIPYLEANLLKKEEQSPSDHSTVKRVLDENTPHYWTQPVNHIPETPRQIYMNNTFLGMHINLPPLNPRVLRRRFHYGLHRNSATLNSFPLYHDGLKGTIQNLQARSNQNYLQRNHMHGAPNFIHQGDHVPKQRARGYGASAQSETRTIKHGNPALNPYINQDLKPLYMPYPLNQNTEQRSVINTTATTYVMNKDQTEFTEEMKRQLRDGKVILLSDSIVSSNYTSDKERDEAPKGKKIEEP